MFTPTHFTSSPGDAARACSKRKRRARAAFGVVASLTLALATTRAAGADQKFWTGLGDGTSWADTSNWNGHTLPGPLDEVTLDSTAPGNYTVTLPAGTTTVSLRRLTITPTGAAVITLRLPAGNTANPGLRVGDGVAGTDDIVLNSGAILKNSSGAQYGNGIEANSIVNGTVRINDGAQYVHNTLRSASGVAPLLSTAIGTELGEFVYDVPGSASANIAASGRTYGSLRLQRTSSATAYSLLGSFPLTIRGRFTLASGTTMNTTMSGALIFQGDVRIEGSPLQIPPTQPLVFSGSGVQTLSGTGFLFYGPCTIAPGATLAVANASFTNDGNVTVNGSFRLDPAANVAGIGTFTYGAGTGTLIFNHGASTFVVGNASLWPAVSGPQNVIVLAPGGISMGAARQVPGLFETQSAIGNAELLQLSGVAQLDAGGAFNGSPNYSGEATLVYNTPYVNSIEWLEGSTVGPGVPKNVTIRCGNGSVALIGTSHVVPGNLTIESGSLQVESGSGGLTLRGNLVSPAPIALSDCALTLSGGAVQTFSAPSIQLRHLVLDKSAGSLVLEGDFDCGVSVGGTSIEFNGASSLIDLNGHLLRLGGAIGGANSNGAFKGSATSSLALLGGIGAGTVRFAPGGEALQDFTVDCGDVGSVTLATPLAVSGTLGLVAGNVINGSNTIALNAGATVDHATGQVDGILSKHFDSGPGSVTFEVGSGGVYAPVDVTLSNVTASGELAVSTTPTDHPNVANAGLFVSKTVNRYWTLTGSGLAFDSGSATFHFSPADIDPGAIPANFAIHKFDSPVWTAAQLGAGTSTSLQATGLTSLSDFAIGEPLSYTLGVTTDANGSVAKSPDQPTYIFGTPVTLTATGVPLYHLDSWSGDASGSTNPLTVIVDRNKTVHASFAIDRYPVNVTTHGVGTVTRNPDLPDYAHGTNVQLTASAGAGYHFSSWDGDAGGTINPVTVTVDGPKTVIANFTPNTTVTWKGNGDGVSWNDGANWSTGVPPAQLDEVLLDNSQVAGDYHVVLPDGSSTTEINSLTLRPSTGGTITLVLPNTNVASPGLRVGDDLAGSDDIVIDSGGVIRNSSGASYGSGIEIVSALNGTLRIDKGGKYVHNTTVYAAPLAQRLSTAPGTEGGEFQYDVPGVADFSISASGITYGSLTLTRSAGAASYKANGAGALTIRGDLRIESQVTLISSMTGTLNLVGNLVSGGAALSLPASQPVSFSSTGVQTITGTAAVILNGTSTIQSGTTLGIGDVPFSNQGTLNVIGTLRLDQGGSPGGSGAYAYQPTTGTLAFNNATGSFLVNGSPYWPTSGGPAIVSVIGAGGITMNVAREVAGTLRVSAPVVQGTLLTLSGVTEMNDGGNFSSSPLYTGTSTLVYNTGALVGNEWIEGTAVGQGIPENVIVRAGAGSVTINGADHSVPGNLTIDSGLLLLDVGTGELHLQGSYACSTATALRNGVLVCVGAGTQTITGPPGLTLDYLRLAKSGGSVQLLADL